MAWRSGEITSISAEVVYENDVFEYELGLEPKLKHIPARSDRGKPVFYYACFKTKLGGVGFKVMSVEEIRAFAKEYSKSSNSSYSPWSTNFDSMAKKTVLKQVLKFAPLKTEFVRGIMSDSTIKSEISDDMSEVRDETEYIEAEVVEDNPNSPQEAAEGGNGTTEV